MNCVQPIRDKEKIEQMKVELQKSGTRDYLIFCLGINTGLRISDIIKLKVKDILNQDRTIKTHIDIIEEKLSKKIFNRCGKSLTPFLSLKDFKIDTRGYRLKEVDQFLDVIIGDYEQFFAIIDSLEKEKAELLREIMALKQDLRNAKMNVEIARKNTDTTEVSNLDILRRLSQLEKEVYGRDDN